MSAKMDISVDDGKVIVVEAATWKGTPYSLIGAESTKGIGGDCSGSTNKIYIASNFPYVYQMASSFRGYAIESDLFRELDSTEQKREGDILSWPDHIAIYSSFSSDPANATAPRTNKAGKPWTQVNDMWTASHSGGPPYAPNQMHWFKPGPPKVFRYQK
jgi:hypothetical protein